MTPCRLSGFKDLTVDERRERVAAASGVDSGSLDALSPENGLTLDQADHMVENMVGILGIPVGIAANFMVNGRDVLVPMATGEPSVVAQASDLARMARRHGGFMAFSTPPLMQAQIQLLDVVDHAAARLRLFEATPELIDLANAQDPRLVALGGGAREIIVRLVPGSRQTYVVLHLVVDVRDAMGESTVDTMAAALAPRAAEIAGGRALLRGVTNKADLRLTRVRAVFDAVALGRPGVVDDMIDAAEFAMADPYRAVTHNKEIMDGVTAVVLATGNDTRAVEAGAHSHAARADGRYTSLSTFEKDCDGNLVGTMELPMPVGLVDDAKKAHPVAEANLALLGVRTAAELAEIIMAVGLARNAAALRALAAEGVERDHLSVDARDVAATADAEPGGIDGKVSRMIAERALRAVSTEKAPAGSPSEITPDRCALMAR